MLRHLKRTKNTHTIVWRSKSVCSWKSHCKSLRSRRRQHNTPEPIVKDIIRRRGGRCDDTTRTPCTHGVIHPQKGACKYTRDTRDEHILSYTHRHKAAWKSSPLSFLSHLSTDTKTIWFHISHQVNPHWCFLPAADLHTILPNNHFVESFRS